MSLLQQRVIGGSAVVPLCLDPAVSLTSELAGPNDGVAVPRWIAELPGAVIAVKMKGDNMEPAIYNDDLVVAWFGDKADMYKASRYSDMFTIVTEDGRTQVLCARWIDQRNCVDVHNLRHPTEHQELCYSTIRRAGLVVAVVRGWLPMRPSRRSAPRRAPSSSPARLWRPLPIRWRRE